jgi:hypothetical protein
MHESKSQTSESTNQIMLPMAVGAIFLVILVAGAILG